MQTRRRESGFTLLEVAAAGALLVGVVGVGASLSRTGSDEFRRNTLDATLDMQAHRAVERIAEELSAASAASVAALPAWPLWDDGIGFLRLAARPGADGTTALRPLRVEFRPEPGETEDGSDEDGDGLVDEGMVVLVLDPGLPTERATVLARSVRSRLEGEIASGDDNNGNGLVDERGLCFERRGDTVTVRLTLERRDAEGRAVVRTVETTVKPRN